MKETFAKVAVFQYSSEAQIVKSRLEAEGLQVFLFDQFTVDTDPLVSNAIGGIKLKVWSQDESRAREILESISTYSLNDEGEEINCNVCGSDRVELFTNVRSIRSLFSFIFSFFTKPVPVYSRYHYHCNNCKQNFNLE